jgi:hypothetical protein
MEYHFMTLSKNSSVLYLTEMDAAIILKEDGTLEASLPDIKGENVPENVLTGAALVYALSNPKMCQLIYNEFAQACKK